MDKLISVIVPVYNRSHIIKRTLISIREQSYKNIEVIVVDDCSNDSDKLREIIKSFSDINIIYTRHSQNLHGGASRNTGIRLAKGEYVAFLDSDDSWHPKKLEICLNYIEEKNVDFVYSQVEKIGNQSGIVPSFSILKNESYTDYLLVRNGSIQTSTIFIKRELLDYVVFDPELKRFQDYDFVLKLELNCNTSFFIARPLVYMFDDDQIGRISNSYDYIPAKFWLNKIGDHLSHKAYYTFLIGRVAQYEIYSGKRFHALIKLLNFYSFINCRKTVWLKVWAVLLIPKPLLNRVKVLTKMVRKNVTKSFSKSKS
ncbi:MULTISPECIES: glycosyltransferase family 2 protein [Shewanella]|uniref:glycosyltransferase family 2 protein n=1 Tax=Shewanella TaxID=22 RepID=UPI0012FF4AB0|nr:glycosyltransferase family 2 protein [Shewanella algae]MBO2640742.1 glycosyltransferase family 2 protein [Shewanella algae]